MAGKKNKGWKILGILLVIFLFLGLISLGIGLYLLDDYQKAPSEDGGFYDFIVESGESAADIGKRLKEEGFIKQELMFRYVVKKEALVLQAGEYLLPKNLGVIELAEELTHGTFDAQITILEGWRREEIADYLYEKKFLSEIVESEMTVFDLRQEILDKIKEGYFYPETYTLPKGISLIELIQHAKATFDEKVDASLLSEFEVKGLTLDEAVILASIVEREANTDESRKIVAGILLKRWQNDWALQADATVQYVMADRDCVNKEICAWWAKEIYQEDLEIDSFYNTRLYPGLPPEAICNPSLSSLQAVAEAEETPYWYYLTGRDGQMYYGMTIEEHLNNMINYL